MKANIGISEANSKAVALILNQLISDEQVLFAKTRNYHWNIESPSFMELHKFYEAQYTELAETIDEIAERVRKIGHYAEGRLKDYLKLANLEEGEYTNDQKTQLKNLLDDHETIIRGIRGHISKVEDDHNDIGTADFLTGVLKQHEQWAWMIRAYLK
ncbi:DNA starvation/stationary phase protection protein [Chitinophaga oryziterrae]|uniref:DNA starvation/stationary phase protection protein n=1 Tax=Chitinophaga oryziterrae TaxID=1031224 RepID=A0A6N8JHI3_9BACT|nr:DNA starvation/stationary phase protection protein [Chitinophaga oryziterrae]MVT44765.1 DNA starvation/stationary phase protection protein [Chitinophaga oryziterrae]